MFFPTVKQIFIRNGFKNYYKNIAIISLKIRKISYNSKPNVVQSKISHINIPQIFLEEYIFKGLDKWHDKVALECAETGRKYTFIEVYNKSRSLANFLCKFRILKQSDTIAIILPNVPEYPIVILGAAQAGLKITLVNPVYTSEEITKQLLDSETKLVFTVTDLYPKVKQAIEKLNINIPVVIIKHYQNQSIPSGTIQFKQIIQEDHNFQFKIERNYDDVVLLPYSSGTTGMPKGVELTNKNIVSNLQQMATDPYKPQNDTEGSDQEVAAAVLPLFHIYGLIMGTFNLLASGCKLVTVPKFGSEIFLKLLNQHHPSFAYLVPPIVLFLSNSPQVQADHISNIRTIISGAAPLGAADIERLQEKSKGKLSIMQAYGLTEASPLTHCQTSKVKNGIKLGGSGFTLPNTECKIISANNESKVGLGSNQSGELLIRGPQVMKGYFHNDEATKAVIDSDGWLRTGDIAHYDEDEQFYITDRIKELIKVKGFQVAPAELEELLRDHPDIEDAAVIGVPHADFGEVPKGFVVPRKNITVNLSDVKKYVAEKVANYKQLAGGIVSVDNIPKSQSGKILRRLLREL